MAHLFLNASALVLVPVLAFAGPASAETDTPDNSEVIVVTATALNDRPGDAMQAVVQLDRSAVVDELGAGLGETLERQPGVSSTFFGRGASRPIIRGLGEDRIRVLSNGLSQVDASAVSPDHAVPSEGLEAQSIEVVRGAAALAYGGNAVGGVVNVLDGRILEAAPGASLSWQVLVSNAAGLDESQVAGAVTLASDHFAVRIDGFKRDAGDYEIPGFAMSAARRALETAAALAAGEPAPDFASGVVPNSFAEADGGAIGLSTFGAWGFAGISARRLETTYGIPEAGPEEPGTDVSVFAGPRIALEQTRFEARAALTQGFGPVEEVRAEATYVDYQHTELEDTGAAGTLFSNEGFDARLEVAHRLGDLRGVAGVTGSSVSFAAEGDEAFVAPTDIEDLGVFVVERLEHGPWSFDAGARVEQRRYDNRTYGEYTFDLVSGAVGARFRPVDGLLLGLSVSRTERAPTEIELFADGAHLATAAYESGAPSLGIETGTSVEGTARWTAARYSLELNAFHIAFADYTTFFDTGVDDVDSGLRIFQAAQRDATFAGGELTAEATLFTVGPWQVRGDASFEVVRAELDGGGNVPRIPPRSLTLGLEGETARLSARVEWVSVADASSLAAFESPTEGYDLFNARLSFRPVAGSDRFVVRLDGRNLTDEEARVHPSFVKDLLPRPGRSVRLVLSSSF